MSGAATAGATTRPALRGKLHEVGFWMSLVAGPLLAAAAPAGAPTLAVAIYAATLAGLLGVSALYHRITWSPERRALLRRLDHAMIFLLIAGTYTPIALTLPPGPRTALLAAIWMGATAGAAVQLVWPHAPRGLQAAVYVALGWTAVVVLPQLWQSLGATGVTLIVAGGALYSLGALVYARRRPDPWPRVLGYHEVFHALVLAAAACHLAVVRWMVIPALAAA